MFSVIDHDKSNNLYCWYDYKGVPSRWVEIMGRRERKYKGFDSIVLKKCAKHGLFETFPDIEAQAQGGFVFGYYLYNIHPIGMGGDLYGKRFSNLSLVPKNMVDTLYRFLNGWYYGDLLLKPEHVAANGHKIFINVPILPTVVGVKDVPFLETLWNSSDAKRHDKLCALGHEALVTINANRFTHSGLTEKTYANINYDPQRYIYPPETLRQKISSSLTVAGGPKNPEWITTKMRRLIATDHIRKYD